jgi:hypothetical protein
MVDTFFLLATPVGMVGKLSPPATLVDMVDTEASEIVDYIPLSFQAQARDKTCKQRKRDVTTIV